MPGPWDKYAPPAAAAPGGGGVMTVGVPHPKEPTNPSGFEPDPVKPGALRPIVGGPADKKESGEQLSPEALDAETTNWILTGKMSPFGMGNGPLRVQIQNNRPVLMKRFGVTENQLPAIQLMFKADSDAYGKRVAQGSFMQQAEEGARGHVEQIKGYLKELPAQTSIKALNAVSLAAQRQMSGETVTNLDTTIPLLKAEIAKIMTANPSGSGQLTDDARHEFDILEGNTAPERKMEALDALLQMADTKVKSNNDEGQRLSQRMTGGLSLYSASGGNGPGFGAVPPTGGAAPTLGDGPVVNGGDGDLGPSLGASGGNTRSVIDPKKQALGQKIVGLVSKGADRNTIMGFAVGADPTLRDDPAFRGWVDEALKYRQQHPKAQFGIDPGFYTTEVPLSGQEKVGNDVAQSGPGAALMNAANGVTAGKLGSITGDQEGVDRALAVAAAQHPNASLVGTMAGGATAAAGLEGALGVGGMVPGTARTAIADAGYGYAAGGPKGAVLGAVGGAGGNALGRLAGATVKGVTNPTVGYVAKEVPLTIGQAVGKSGVVGRAVKGIEDRLSGIPVVGDAINARRLEGLQKMNAKAFDRALEPIGAKAEGRFGEEAVAHAQDQVSAAFSKALSGKSAGLDHGFITDATKAKMGIEKLPDRVRGEVDNSINEVINNYFDAGGQVSGENMQAMLRELGQIKRGYQGDPLGHRIGQVVDQFSDSIENMFRRQAPDVMPQYDAAKKAFKRVSTLEDAVLKGKQTGGVFTSAQLGMADRANTIKYGGKHTAAAGGGEFHDFQRKMQDVLPSKVPDSGTAGRLLIPSALIAGGAGAGAAGGDAEKGLTLGALLAMAYSRTGQRMLTGAVLKGGPARAATGAAIRKAGPLIGHGVGAVTALGTARD